MTARYIGHRLVGARLIPMFTVSRGVFIPVIATKGEERPTVLAHLFTPSGSLDGCEQSLSVSLALAPMPKEQRVDTTVAGTRRLAAGGSPAPILSEALE